MIRAVDLYCGAGGLSRGLAEACESLNTKVALLAINHWPIAVATHTRNHPWARHLTARVSDLNPREAAESAWLDILGAGVECTHHSHARGGRPMSDQSRAASWDVVRWADHLNVSNILVECVKELRDWGPLNAANKPIASRKGETYKAFLNALCSLGYTVEDRVLCAADYGDPTTRERLFVMATKRRRGIHWPKPSHFEHPAPRQKRWVAARDIIDWEFPSQSIFDRKKPLAPGTRRRIAAGLKRFCGEYAEAFLVMLYGTGTCRSIDRPVPVVTAGGGHIALAQPFLVPIDNRSTEGGARPITGPVGTITTKNRWAICEPCMEEPGFLVRYKGTGKREEYCARSVGRPMPALVTRGDIGLVQPSIVKYYGRDAPDGVDVPLATVTTKDRFGLAEPVAVEANGKFYLDIKFRMLQPHELAAAMSMGDFVFEGNKGDAVRQIGNAVPVKMAKALCMSLLRPELSRISVAA